MYFEKKPEQMDCNQFLQNTFTPIDLNDLIVASLAQ